MSYKFNPFTGTLDYYESGSGSGVTGIPPTDIGAIAQWADTAGTMIANSPGTFVQPGGALQTQGFIGSRSITTEVQIPAESYMIASELELELTGSLEIEPDGELIIL